MLRVKIKRRFFEYMRKSELQSLLLFFVTAFISLSLLSYHHQDPSWCYFSTTPHAVSNWCGIAGAQLAAFLIYLFGSMAFAIIPFFIFLTYQASRRVVWSSQWERVISFLLMIMCGSALASLHGFDFLSPHVHGGLIGRAFYLSLYGFFDQVGSALALYTMAAATMVVSTRLTFFYFFKHIGHAGLSLIRFSKKHHLVAKAFFIGKKVVVYALYPLRLLYAFGHSLLDGSAFIETGLDVPADCTDCLHISPLVTSQKKLASPAEPFDEHASSDMAEQYDMHEIEDALPDLKTRLAPSRAPKKYVLPTLDIFFGVENEKNDTSLQHELEQRAGILQEKLERFGIEGKVVAIKRGPVVTLFEYQPDIDTKLSKILALEDDLAMALQALSIRILAPIPGKSVVGFEVANKKRRNVSFAVSVSSKTFQHFKGALPLILGEDTIGKEVIVDLARMPHLLIAGSTGSGKSVALNGMLISLLCKRSPQDLRLILIDPKRLEFAPYTDIAHLLFPIITDPRRAAPVLRFVVQEMENRYEAMAEVGARNIVDFNEIQKKNGADELAYIVVVIDELSDLMLTAGREIEDLITRLAQMARAAGIHMIVATQRPSVDVITGLIKVNFPSRISFRVTSKIDSRTILDCGGAEKLLGRGDMLFMDSTASHLNRVHGAYVSDEEIAAVVDHIRSEQEVEYRELPVETARSQELNDADDQLYQEVLQFIDEIEDVSISLLQRRFRIGYNRSARLIEMLEAEGRIMPADGGKTRKIIR